MSTKYYPRCGMSLALHQEVNLLCCTLKPIVKWSRSDDGCTESKCGRFRIEPLFIGCTTPQAYDLYDNGDKVARYCNTQREAKVEADHIVDHERKVATA